MLEKLIPYRTDWARDDFQGWNDWGHMALGVLASRFARDLLILAVPFLGTLVPASFGGILWPSSLPFAAQLVLVFLIADFGRYWQHRWLHRSAGLWRFHALHHSAERLNAMKVYRSHFLERFVQSIVTIGPLFALGVPGGLLWIYSSFNVFLGLFSHSNADIRLGYFELVFNGPATHRYHHSVSPREGDRNFGSALVIWDQVFGTYLSPFSKPGPETVGLHQGTVPRAWWSQLLLRSK